MKESSKVKYTIFFEVIEEYHKDDFIDGISYGEIISNEIQEFKKRFIVLNGYSFKIKHVKGEIIE